MITMWSVPGCALCRKARAWCKEEPMTIRQEPFFAFLLDTERLQQFVSQHRPWLEEQFSDVKNLSSWKDARLTSWLQNNPSRLPRPMVFADNEPEAVQQRLMQHFLSDSHQTCPASCTILSGCRAVRGNDRALLVIDGLIMEPSDLKNLQPEESADKPVQKKPAGSAEVSCHAVQKSSLPAQPVRAEEPQPADDRENPAAAAEKK